MFRFFVRWLINLCYLLAIIVGAIGFMLMVPAVEGQLEFFAWGYYALSYAFQLLTLGWSLTIGSAIYESMAGQSKPMEREVAPAITTAYIAIPSLFRPCRYLQTICVWTRPKGR